MEQEQTAEGALASMHRALARTKNDACCRTARGISVVNVAAAVEKYGDAVLRLALCRAGNRTDAEDIAQNVFVKLCETHRSFESEEHLKAWLLRVTATCSIDARRDSWRRRRAEGPESEDAMTNAAVEREDLPFCDTETRPREQAVAQAVASLPEKQRIAVHLYYLEGYSIPEISEITKDKAVTVRSRLHRGRASLRRLMQEHDM